MSDKAHSEQRQVATRGAVWVFLGTVLNLLVRLGSMSVLARLLTPADYGVVAAAMALFAFVALVGEAGFRPALVQRTDIEQRHISVAFTATVAGGLLLWAAAYFAGRPVEAFFRIDGLAEVIQVLGVALFIQCIAVAPRAILAREMKFRTLAAMETVSYVAGYALVSIACGLAGLRYWSLVAGQIAQLAVMCAIALFLCRRRLGLNFDIRTFVDLTRTSIAYSVTALVNLIALQGDSLLVGRLMGSHALGLYGRAYQLMTLPVTLLNQVLDYVLFPSLSRIQHDRDRMGESLHRSSSLSALVGLPAGAVLAILSPEVVAVLFGDQWGEVAPVLQILSWGMFFRIGYKFSWIILASTGRSVQTAVTQTLYMATVLIGVAAGTRFGLQGVAWAVLFALAVVHVATLALAMRATGYPLLRYLKATAPGCATTVLSAVVVLAVATFTRRLGLPIVTLGGAGLAIICCGALLFLPKVREVLVGRENWEAILSVGHAMRARRSGSTDLPAAAGTTNDKG